MRLVSVALLCFTVIALPAATSGDATGYFLRVSGNRPYGVVFDGHGFMYMVTAPDSGAGTLSRVDPNGRVVDVCTLNGTFIGPGITLDTEGNLLVTLGNRLVRISPAGNAVTVADGFKRCFDVKLDCRGNIYVADDCAGAIYRIAPGKPRDIFYQSDTTGSFRLTGMCFDSRCRHLFLRDGRKLLRIPIRPDSRPGDPETILDAVDLFYLCAGRDSTMYASTPTIVIRVDGRNRFMALSGTRLNAPAGLALGGEGFEENNLYVTVADGIVCVPIR